MPKKEHRRKEKGSYIRSWVSTYLMYFTSPEDRIFTAFKRAIKKQKPSSIKSTLLDLMEAYSVQAGTYKNDLQYTFADVLETLPKNIKGKK
jgi:hypothetical protein